MWVSKIFKTGTSESEDAPYFEKSLYEVEVKEDEKLHTPIMRIAAQNHDEATNIRYEITGGNIGGVFAVDSQTGDVSLAAKLDYESKKIYELRLSVTDEESMSYTSLRVTVLDVNDNPPVFDKPLYRALVLEEDSTNLPKKILQVNVSDSDIDRPRNIDYFLTGPGVDADVPSNGKFSINKTSGEVYVLQPLDRDLPHGRPQWRFTVFAQDEGGEGLVGYADIHVNLQDVNDNAPIFLQSLSTTNLTENGTAGMVVVTMTATDQDDPLEGGNAQLVYNIEKNVLDEQTGTPIFSIEPHSGLIRTNICCLDREKTPDYSLQVVAMDGGGLKGTGTVSIIVSDINDMPPAFTKDEWVTEVSESEDGRIPDHAILTVNVIDQDETNDFYYKVVEGSGLGTDKFMMVRNPDGTGSLRVTNPLDYEDPLQSSGFRFKIQVNDQGPNSTEDKNHVASSWVVVRLRDINDNSPRFDKTSSTVSLQEDVEVGTLVDTFLARDPDQGGQGRVTYSIHRESDRRRHFHVSEDGRITVQRPLDRERSAIHKILLTASDDGDPPRTTTATLTVNVLDVNDNAPRLLVEYRPILLENTAPRTLLELFAQDMDDHAKGNGPPYTFHLDPATNHSLNRLFSVDTNPRGGNGHGVAIVSSLVSFDRERHKEYHLPITIQDSGDPLMIGTSTLTVVIGDVNDNRMAAGTTDILVYKLKGSIEDMEVGRVYVEDKDDWDLPDKSFYWESSPSPQFHLDQETGTLRISGDTAEGDYRLRVRVRDSRHSLDTVVSSVTVMVRQITMADWYHSEVVTFQGVTDRDFIVKGNSTVSRLETFREVVGQLLETDTENVLVFSVQPSPGDSSRGGKLYTGVRFCVKEHSEYFKPVRLLGEMLLNRNTIESAVSANIFSIGEEQCQDEELCEGDSGCRTMRNILPALHIVNGNTTVLAGPRVEETADCVCDARDFSVPESCSSHSCLNGGTCYDTRQGPRCSCPEYHDGPRCQQMTRGFQGDGWAWYPSLQACLSSHLNLEFLTTAAHGQLLYNGPLGPPNPNSFFVTDFISVELVDGMPQLLLDLGSGTVKLKLGSRLDDGDWHRIDVMWDSEEVRLIVDQCRNRNVTDAMDREVTDDDLTECQAVTALPPFSSQLNVHTPLQIGGWRIQPFLPGQYGWSAAPKGIGFNGCIKNIFYNSQSLTKPQTDGNKAEYHMAGHIDSPPNTPVFCVATDEGNWDCLSQFVRGILLENKPDLDREVAQIP
ncbi:beta-catenin binding [Homalodisca vitripennis]|nr:beta-catenin binding [Homalodisca vitripennis]